MRRRYARRAWIYDAICRPLYRRPRRALQALVADCLHAHPAPTVLEIGAGTGLNLPGLAVELPPATRLIALDLNPTMLRRARRPLNTARRRLPHSSLLLAPTTALPEASADLILLSFVLAVTPDWHHTLTEARRLLRPGGHLLILDSGRFQGVHRWLNPLLGPLIAWSGHADLDLPFAASLPPPDQLHLGGLARLWMLPT